MVEHRSDPIELRPPVAKDIDGAPDTIQHLQFTIRGQNLLGLPAGSQGYASGPNTVSWHFVFSDALRCWAPAFLTGMAFLGLQKIIDLLKERGE